MYSLWERIKSGIAEFVQSRIFVLIIVFCITSAILVQRIFYLQIVKGQEYLDDYIMNWHIPLQSKITDLMTA